MYSIVSNIATDSMSYDIVFSPKVVTTYVVRLPTFFKDLANISRRFVQKPSVFSVNQRGGDVEVSILNDWSSDIISACAEVDSNINHIVLDETMKKYDHGIEPMGDDDRPRAIYSSIRIISSDLISPDNCGCEIMKR